MQVAAESRDGATGNGFATRLGAMEVFAMWPSFGSLVVAPWILFAQMTWTTDAVPVHAAVRTSSGAGVEIRDHAGLFGRDAARRAGEALGQIHRHHRLPIIIETIASLDGAWVADAARERARSASPGQLFILLAGDEREVGVIAARRGPASRLAARQREAIRQAFLGPLRAGETDRALEQGVRAIGTAVAAPGPGPVAWEPPFLAATLLAALALLAASRLRRRRGRHRRASAEAISPVPGVDPPPGGPTAHRTRSARSALDDEVPRPAARPSARCRETVGP